VSAHKPISSRRAQRRVATHCDDASERTLVVQAVLRSQQHGSDTGKQDTVFVSAVMPLRPLDCSDHQVLGRQLASRKGPLS
jgi:hypothetical protein